nr:MAG TPA: hypothetical protein [Caudoviricetes sp.]
MDSNVRILGNALFDKTYSNRLGLIVLPRNLAHSAHRPCLPYTAG